MWFITTFRMWTAAHIFIYGALLYLFDGKWRGVIIASLAVLVHYSFLVPVGVLYAYILFGNRLIVYFTFFVATFFFSQINLNTFNNVVNSYAPEIIQERTSGYRSEQNVETLREDSGDDNRVWYAETFGKALSWSVAGFLILLFVRGRKFFSDHKKWMSLFCFVLLFYGVANIFSSLPSGARFVTIANTIALALIVLYMQNKQDKKALRQILFVSTPFLLLFIIVSVRMALYSLSATAVMGNPFIAFFFNEGHISLNDVLKMII